MRNGNRVRLELGQELGLGSWLGLGLGAGLGFYFAAVLHNFSQFYTFHVAQMWNGWERETVYGGDECSQEQFCEGKWQCVTC